MHEQDREGMGRMGLARPEACLCAPGAHARFGQKEGFCDDTQRQERLFFCERRSFLATRHALFSTAHAGIQAQCWPRHGGDSLLVMPILMTRPLLP